MTVRLTTRDVLRIAASSIEGLAGHTFDVLELSRPTSHGAAINLTRIISKLSPLLGNLIEFNTVEVLNHRPEFRDVGKWERQDPGFPDAIFRGQLSPAPGLEIKAWFPLATEITARFKDSQNAFVGNNIDVAILAWLPEHLIFGRPKILAACVVSGSSIAKARDTHYHNPPDYLVVEPNDTASRTRNLQQSNTSGYKWQGDATSFQEAVREVDGWGQDARFYLPSPTYQQRVRSLMQRYDYRLDTNYAKIDRIVHDEIEAFKTTVLNAVVEGQTVSRWAALFASKDEARIAEALHRQLKL